MTGPVGLSIELTTSQVRPVAYRILSKKHGLNLKSTGLQVLAKVLGHRFGVEWRGASAEKFLDEVARQWKEQDRGLFIDGEPLSSVIKDILNMESKDTESVETGVSNETTDVTKEPSTTNGSSKKFHWKDYFSVVNAMDQPMYKYNPSKKYFESVSHNKTGGPSLIGTAKDRADIFCTRYHLVKDRVQRDEAFHTPSFSGNTKGKTWHTITPIKNMLGMDGKGFLLLGMLGRGPDGRWCLQDVSGRVVLDVDSDANPSDQAYYTMGSIVLCSGVYQKEVFIVETLGPPTAERRETTKEALGNIDFLGIHSALNSTAPGSKTGGRVERIDKTVETQLRAHERQLTNHKIVVVGCDLFLDQVRIIDALRKLFDRLQLEMQQEGDDNSFPVAIVLPGSFVSSPIQPNGGSSQYKEYFDDFAQLLGEFPELMEKSTLVFVPGDNDPWAAIFSSGAAPCWPQTPIPSVFTSRLKRVCPNAVWASNPSRLTYLSQELAFVRDDYGGRFRRNSILTTSDEDKQDEDEEMPDEPRTASAESTQVDIRDNDNYNDDEDDDILSNRRALDNLVLENQKPISQLEKPYVSPDLAESRKVVRTLLDQGHLSPFPLDIRPVAWQYDHALLLTPLPSMLVLADPTTPKFRVTYQGCHVINPGKFLEKNKVNWVEYYPSSTKSEPKFLYI
ncbi:hypothetical protein TRICI_000270 [Trichomonascus ciferrii]|uniref:DNA polymerase epsilon subunit B n=1 Tax=Trichomonascus ciferrii TaxID=44093 RepID=A0A642VDX3_9ASCO|nr:hypothetical protein TRICI_000270 [Trichomonascus ciferrii]